MSKKTYRYSDCFKLSVVTEIEKNGLTIQEARLKYGISESACPMKYADMNFTGFTMWNNALH